MSFNNNLKSQEENKTFHKVKENLGNSNTQDNIKHAENLMIA